MSNLNAFAKFGNYPKKFTQKVTQKVAVAYTRVSTKEQGAS
ncbi:hypothetical protein [Chitinophaga oryziterrae]|nr:hypothetical protein [Chitinophaga oryziterrae]